MKRKLSVLYSWFVRTATAWLPDIPVFMRFRGFLYSLMMKRCGRNFQVASTVILNSLSGLSIGHNVYFAPRATIIATDIEIGDEVLIGPGTCISGGNHTFLKSSYRYGAHIPQPVSIKSGAWIAANCSVTAGSVLPERSVLAAGAVLTKPFTQSDSLYAGVPAVCIKKLRDYAE